MATLRVGIGYDVHPLVEGRTLVLGGVELSFERGLAGHSDGDALCHAIIDALLGAASAGDIGARFPPGDDRFRGACSLELLAQTWSSLRSQGWRLVNVDATVVAEQPRLAPAILSMRRRLADALQTELARVSVKATTTDGLGAIGRGEGIAVQAVAMIEKAAAEQPSALGSQRAAGAPEQGGAAPVLES